MRIVWQSVAPWLPSGYGMQTAQVCRRLRDAGHDVAISAIAGVEGMVAMWEDIPVFPQDHTRFNKYALRKYVERWSANGTGDDVQVITLQDVWVWGDAGHQTGGTIADYQGLNLAAWCPVDVHPLPPNTMQALDYYAARPIAMSKHGEGALRDGGYDPLYVPHAVDTSLMKPSSEGAAAIRSVIEVPEDAFLIGVCGYNQGIAPSRKAFPEIFHAFSVFQSSHPDAILYLHTDIYGLSQGLNLPPMWREYGIPDSAIRHVDQDAYGTFCQVTQQHMGYMYSALDVLLMPSYGEGFGVPLIEAQACGTPVITTDWTAMTELSGPAGWLCEGEYHRNAGSASQWMKPALSEILRNLGKAYEARGDQELRDACREFALQYDADRVFAEHWVPTLEALGRPREVPPLPAAKVRRKPEKAAA